MQVLNVKIHTHKLLLQAWCTLSFLHLGRDRGKGSWNTAVPVQLHKVLVADHAQSCCQLDHLSGIVRSACAHT